MADDSPKSVGNGVLGHLPPLPRRALSNSFIAMEQASRQREGLPLLTDADIEALKAGRPMSWESGVAASAPVTTSTPPAPAPATTAAAPAAPPPAAAATTTAPSAEISERVAKWVAAGKKWSKSAIAAEQAGRSRSGLPALNDVEVAALLGEPVAPAAAAPAAPQSAAATAARSGESTRYVGTPAVGTSKAAASGGVASVGPEDNEVNQQRRRLAW